MQSSFWIQDYFINSELRIPNLYYPYIKSKALAVALYCLLFTESAQYYHSIEQESYTQQSAKCKETGYK